MDGNDDVAMDSNDDSSDDEGAISDSRLVSEDDNTDDEGRVFSVKAVQNIDTLNGFVCVALQLLFTGLCFVYVVKNMMAKERMNMQEFKESCIPEGLMPWSCVLGTTLLSSFALLILQGPTNSHIHQGSQGRSLTYLVFDWGMLILLVCSSAKTVFTAAKLSIYHSSPLCGLAVVCTSSLPVKCFQIMALDMLITKSVQFELLHNHRDNPLCKRRRNKMAWSRNMNGVLRALGEPSLNKRKKAFASSWAAWQYHRISADFVKILFFGKGWRFGILSLAPAPTMILYLPFTYLMSKIIWLFSRGLQEAAVHLTKKARGLQAELGPDDLQGTLLEDFSAITDLGMRRTVLQKVTAKGPYDWISGKTIAAPFQDFRLQMDSEGAKKRLNHRYEQELKVFKIARTPQIAYRYYYAFPLFAGLAIPMFTLMTIQLTLTLADMIDDAWEHRGALSFVDRLILFGKAYTMAFLDTIADRNYGTYFQNYTNMGKSLIGPVLGFWNRAL